MTPFEYLMEYRILKASEELAKNDKSIRIKAVGTKTSNLSFNIDKSRLPTRLLIKPKAEVPVTYLLINKPIRAKTINKAP